MINKFFNWINFVVPSVSSFYALSVGISLLIVIITLWTTFDNCLSIFNLTAEPSKDSDKSADNCVTPEIGLQARFKIAKQKVIQKELTPEQVAEEHCSETQTLAAIYKLLQEKADWFPNATMKDLENQLKLYKQ